MEAFDQLRKLSSEAGFTPGDAGGTVHSPLPPTQPWEAPPYSFLRPFPMEFLSCLFLDPYLLLLEAGMGSHV